MAKRRMFSNTVVHTEKFNNLSVDARLLYFDLGMFSDDEGFIEIYSVIKMTNSNETALNELIEFGYIQIINDELVGFITHWNINNLPIFMKKNKSRYHSFLNDVNIEYCKNEHHWNWRGGITPENARERHSKRYYDWREKVFIRDNYTCQICNQHGGKLNAHHKKKWSEYLELRFDIDNGITLCEDCHKRVHKEKIIL